MYTLEFNLLNMVNGGLVSGHTHVMVLAHYAQGPLQGGTKDVATLPQSEGSEKILPDLMLSGLPPIPPHLVKAIKQGMYLDLPNLLSKALGEAHLNKARETKEETKLKRRFSVTTTLDWMAAFSAYTAVAVHLKPQRAFKLPA